MRTLPKGSAISVGTTSSAIKFFVRSTTTGQGLTGLVAADFSGTYSKNDGTQVALSFADGTLGAAYSSGLVIPAGGGWYFYHAPNLMFDTIGGVSVTINSTGLDATWTGQVVAYDPEEASNLGLGNLNATVGSRSSHSAPPNFDQLSINGSGEVVASNMRGTDGANTVAPNNADISATLAAVQALAFPANFATLVIDGNGEVIASNMRGTDGANTIAPDNASIGAIGSIVTSIANALPTNFDVLVIDGTGRVTTSNPASGGGSAHTAEDVAALILATPANKIAANASGEVVASNMRGTDGAFTGTIGDIRQEIDDNSTVLTGITNLIEALNDIDAESVRVEMDANSTQLANANSRLVAMQGDGFDGSTDSLEAIRNRGDAAWLTGGGGSGGSGDLTSILGTPITESSPGQLAAAFSFWYGVATAAKTINDVGGSAAAAEIITGVVEALSSVSIKLLTPYSIKTKRLELVQRADYTADSATGPIRVLIELPGVSVGDEVRFGATLDGEEIQATGEVVDIASELHAEVELTKDDTNKKPSPYWKWELEHVSGGGDVSPLVVDADMTLHPSHAEAST